MSRRESLKNVEKQASTSAGLWLDKYVKSQDKAGQETGSNDKNKSSPRQGLVDEVSSIKEPDEYKKFYLKWQKSLTEIGAITREAKVEGRMIVGLGEESVIETSITLHRTYGVPYIPGSAIKGMAASFVRNYLEDDWAEDSKAYRTVFGDTDDAGYITFFDALYIPGTGHSQKALWPDIITVHHPDYYQGKDKPPADWDSPTPIPFLSATGKYLVALAGPEKWVDTVFQILKYAFEDIGIGAKTSSGYGRLSLDAPLKSANSGAVANQASDSRVKKIIEGIKSIPVKDVAGTIKQKGYDEWEKLTNDEEKKDVAKAIIEKVKQASWEKNAKQKEWYKKLVTFSEEH